MKSLFKYRPEIDGLRGIAILPVILFHADFQKFEGGYVGVDIFFVISGYLISSIIISEVESGKFLLTNFYERRARRILPALFCVILFSIPFAWLILLPADLELFNNSALSALTFWSNYIFYFEIDYFETSSWLKPLLHTWSLSIEEQFYIIFPILLLFFFKFKKNFFIIFLSIIAVLSLFIAQWSGNLKFSYPFIEKELLFFSQSSLANFFLPFGRVWELIIGILISFYLKKKGQPIHFNQIFSLLGLLLILYSIFIFTKDTNYPSFQTLLPTVGTGLLILFMNKNTFAYKIFSQKILVFLGLISYSAYLYHYPIFTFIEYSDYLEIGVLIKIFLIFFIFFLSYLSWKFVEKPFRSKTKISSKKFYYILIVFYLFSFFLFTITFFNNGFKYRFDNVFKNFSINFNIKELTNETSLYGETLIQKNKFESEKKKKILIIGNSLSIDLLMAFEQNKDLFNDYEFKGYYFEPVNLIENSQKNKIELNKLINNDLFINADVLMISSSFSKYETSFKKNNVIKLFNDLAIKYDKLLVITGNNPHFFDARGINPILTILLKNRKKNLSEYDLNKIYFKKLSATFKNIGKKVKHLTKEMEIIFLDKFDYSCSLIKETCDALTSEGELAYIDVVHYSKKGAKYFGKKIHEVNWLLPIDNYYK